MNRKGCLEVLAFLVFFILLISLIAFLLNLGLKKECKMEADLMGFEWEYNIWIECMIKVDNKWIPLESYIVTKEELSK